MLSYCFTLLIKMVSYKLIVYDRTILDRWFFSLFRTYRLKYLFKKLSVLISRIEGAFKCSKTFLSYQDYNKKVAFIDRFNFEQKTRKENIKNLNAFTLKKKKNITRWLLILCLITPLTNWLIPFILLGAFLKKYKKAV